jgi:ankyrin repeat protein
LIYAAVKGDPEVVKMLLAKGAWVNVKDKSGQTPLALATRMNHPEVKGLLSQAGAKY